VCCIRGKGFYQADQLKIRHAVTLRNLAAIIPSGSNPPKRIEGKLGATIFSNSVCGAYVCGEDLFTLTSGDSEADEASPADPQDPLGTISMIPYHLGWSLSSETCGDTMSANGSLANAGGRVEGDPDGAAAWVNASRYVNYSTRSSVDPFDNCRVIQTGTVGTFYDATSAASYTSNLDLEEIDPLQDSELGVQVILSYNGIVSLFGSNTTDCGTIERCADLSGNLVMVEYRALVPVLIEYTSGDNPTRAIVGGTIRVKSSGAYEVDGVFADPGFSLTADDYGYKLNGYARCCIASDPSRTPSAVRILSASVGESLDNPGDFDLDGVTCWSDLGLLGFALDASSLCQIAGLDYNGDGLLNDLDRVALHAVLIARPCPADLNCDEFVDFFDYDAFVDYFENGLRGDADYNGDGVEDFFDYEEFIGAFEIGC
jgi:hypothetical protein